MDQAPHLHVDAYEVTLEDIGTADLDRLHALSMGVNWPHRADDWRMLLDLGSGLVAVDEIGRVIGSAMWFHYEPDVTVIGMMITTPRLQELGAGRRLLTEVLARNQGRRCVLTATHGGKRLYRSLGFGFERPIHQCQGEAIAPPPLVLAPGDTLRPVGPDDFVALLAFETEAIGYRRPALLHRLLAGSTGVALMREGRIAAMSLCRRFGRGHVVGPLYAATDADAIAVLTPHVEAHAGRFLRTDTPEVGGDYTRFIADCGLLVFDIVWSMGLQAPAFTSVVPDGIRRYGLASQALG
ncbi:GNAT family N-acetyltransferase [Methyloraptor flagellatus]|uniref:GNAT family N-acetyltransferase n=1 Tax=Methyloraptor flagellatus TaxID=3162530 RepID=A0AAU7XF43_9HYPH